MFVVDKKKRSCKIIDFIVPGDSMIEEKEKVKIGKYQDLGRELQKIWNVKVKIIPLVVGSLGAIPKQFGKRLKQIGITAGTAQKSKSKATGCGSISTVFSSIVLLCVSSIIININNTNNNKWIPNNDDDDNNNNNNNNNRIMHAFQFC